jgi:hypothetical protein
MLARQAPTRWAAEPINDGNGRSDGTVCRETSIAPQCAGSVPFLGIKF